MANQPKFYWGCGLCGGVHFPKLAKDDGGDDGDAEEPENDEEEEDEDDFDADLTEAENAAKEMVRCDVCHVCVHRACYGVGRDATKVGWRCDWCSSLDDSIDTSAPAACVLCPTRSAVLPIKRWTSSEGGGWVHLVCAVAASSAVATDSSSSSSGSGSGSGIGIDLRTMGVVLPADIATRRKSAVACALCGDCTGVLIECDGVAGEFVHASCASRRTAACDLRFMPIRDGVVERSGVLSKAQIPSSCVDPMRRVQIPGSGLPPAHGLRMCAFRPVEAAFPMPIYCVCRKVGYEPEDPTMIDCVECKEWFHAACIGEKASSYDEDTDFTCSRCTTRLASGAATTTLDKLMTAWNVAKAETDEIEFELPNMPLLLAMAQCAVRHAAAALAARENAPLPAEEQGDEGTGESYVTLDDEMPWRAASKFSISAALLVAFNLPHYKDLHQKAVLAEHTNLFLPNAEWRFAPGHRLSMFQTEGIFQECSRAIGRISGVCRQKIPTFAQLTRAIEKARTWQTDALLCIGTVSSSLGQLDVDVSNLQLRADKLDVDVTKTDAFKKLRWKLKAEAWQRRTVAALDSGRAGGTNLRALAALVKESNALDLDDDDVESCSYPCLERLRGAAFAATRWKGRYTEICPPAHATRRGLSTRETPSVLATISDLDALQSDASSLLCVVAEEEKRLAKLCDDARVWCAKAAALVSACATRYGAAAADSAVKDTARTKDDLASVAQLLKEAQFIPISMPSSTTLEIVGEWLRWTVEAWRVLPHARSADSSAEADRISSPPGSIREIGAVISKVPETPEGWNASDDSAGVRELLEKTYNDAIAADQSLDEHIDAVFADTAPTGSNAAETALRELVASLTTGDDALSNLVTMPALQRAHLVLAIIQWQLRVEAELVRRAPQPAPSLKTLLVQQRELDDIMREASNAHVATTPGAASCRDELSLVINRVRWLCQACAALKFSAGAPKLRALIAAAGAGTASSGAAAAFAHPLGKIADMQHVFDAAFSALKELMWRVTAASALRSENFPRDCDSASSESSEDGGGTSLTQLEELVASASGLNREAVFDAQTGAFKAAFAGFSCGDEEGEAGAMTSLAPPSLDEGLRALQQRVGDAKALNQRVAAATAIPQPTFPDQIDGSKDVVARLTAHLETLRALAAEAVQMGVIIPMKTQHQAEIAQLEWALAAQASLLAVSDVVELRSLAAATLGEVTTPVAALISSLSARMRQRVQVADEWGRNVSSLLTHSVAFDTEAVSNLFLKEDRTHSRCAPQPAIEALRALLEGASQDRRLDAMQPLWAIESVRHLLTVIDEWSTRVMRSTSGESPLRMVQMLRPLEELQKDSLHFPVQCSSTRRIDTAVSVLRWVQSCSHQLGLGPRAAPDELRSLAVEGSRVLDAVAKLPAPPLAVPELAPQHKALTAALEGREKWMVRAMSALDSASDAEEVRKLLDDKSAGVGTAPELLLLRLCLDSWGVEPVAQKSHSWSLNGVYWVKWKGWLPWPAVIEEIKRESGATSANNAAKRITLHIRFLRCLGGRGGEVHERKWVDADTKLIVPFAEKQVVRDAALQIQSYADAVLDAQQLVRRRLNALNEFKKRVRGDLRSLFPAMCEAYAAQCKASKVPQLKIVGVPPEREKKMGSAGAALAAPATHVALDNETPAQIARLHGVGVEALLEINRPRYGKDFTVSAQLYEGTEVLVPSTSDSVMEMAFAAATKKFDPRMKKSDPRNTKARKRGRSGGNGKASEAAKAAAKRSRVANTVEIDSSRIVKLRETARTKLASALAPGSASPSASVFETASAIERGLITLNPLPARRADYVDKFRDLVTNLQRNADLRERVVSSLISPIDLCNMKASEMATREEQQKRAAQRDEYLATQVTVSMGSGTKRKRSWMNSSGSRGVKSLKPTPKPTETPAKPVPVAALPRVLSISSKALPVVSGSLTSPKRSGRSAPGSGSGTTTTTTGAAVEPTLIPTASVRWSGSFTACAVEKGVLKVKPFRMRMGAQIGESDERAKAVAKSLRSVGATKLKSDKTMKTDRLTKWSGELRQSKSRIQTLFVCCPAHSDDMEGYAALAAQLKTSGRSLVTILPKQLGTLYLTPPGWHPAPPLPQIPADRRALVLHALVVTRKS